jgi:hypothetical protein
LFDPKIEQNALRYLGILAGKLSDPARNVWVVARKIERFLASVHDPRDDKEWAREEVACELGWSPDYATRLMQATHLAEKLPRLLALHEAGRISEPHVRIAAELTCQLDTKVIAQVEQRCWRADVPLPRLQPPRDPLRMRPHRPVQRPQQGDLETACLRHHHCKHDAGWSVLRDQSGTTWWTSPTGRRYAKPIDESPAADP